MTADALPPCPCCGGETTPIKGMTPGTRHRFIRGKFCPWDYVVHGGEAYVTSTMKMLAEEVTRRGLPVHKNYEQWEREHV